MKHYLLDTDTCVDVLRNRKEVIEALKRVSPDDVAISSMTEAELRFGCLMSSHPESNLNQLEKFLSLIAVIPFESKAADMHAYIRGKLKGRATGAHDFIIGSVARVTGRILVTSNVAEFERIAGLRVESWRV